VALSAQRERVLRDVLGTGLLLGVIGMAAGIVAAFGLTRSFRDLLFGVSTLDPLTFAVIPLLLLAVTLFACYVPARHATKVDPASHFETSETIRRLFGTSNAADSVVASAVLMDFAQIK
jgi:ABC-type antimicrobial peptide transport system permease subunit